MTSRELALLSALTKPRTVPALARIGRMSPWQVAAFLESLRKAFELEVQESPKTKRRKRPITTYRLLHPLPAKTGTPAPIVVPADAPSVPGPALPGRSAPDFLGHGAAWVHPGPTVATLEETAALLDQISGLCKTVAHHIDSSQLDALRPHCEDLARHLAGLTNGSLAAPPGSPAPASFQEAMDAYARILLARALEHSDSNLWAAASLGMSTSAFTYRAERLGLRLHSEKPGNALPGPRRDAAPSARGGRFGGGSRAYWRKKLAQEDAEKKRAQGS